MYWLRVPASEARYPQSALSGSSTARQCLRATPPELIAKCCELLSTRTSLGPPVDMVSARCVGSQFNTPKPFDCVGYLRVPHIHNQVPIVVIESQPIIRKPPEALDIPGLL